MKGFNFIENAKNEEDLGKKMFPEMFELSKEDRLSIKGGKARSKECDAVCLPSEWGGTCSCYNNVA